MSTQSLYRPITIGPVHIEGNLFLAPLAGYTDRSMRFLALEQGANLSYTEMVSAEGLARNSKPTKLLLRPADNETLLAVQLFGPKASVFERSLENLSHHRVALIDINCGCPVPKVIKTGAGSALLRSAQTIYEIVSVMTKARLAPVSVKIRLGWDAKSINYRETTDAAVQGGALMITMHARTKTMGYAGQADWEALADLKSYLKATAPHVLLFGSGDLFSPSDAQKMLQQTGVDGIMFARGALGNPFIFAQSRQLLQTGHLPPLPTASERTQMLLKHLNLLIKDVGEEAGCTLMRKHAAHYVKGIPGSSSVKQAVVQARSYAEYKEACSLLPLGLS